MFSWAYERQKVLLFYPEQFFSPLGNTWMQKSLWIISWCGPPGTDVPERQSSTEAGLWEHGWPKTIEPKGKEALVSGQGSIVPITVGTQQMHV